MSEAPTPEPDFAELVAATGYSFLRGVSHPAEMVRRAIELGMAGIGIAYLMVADGGWPALGVYAALGWLAVRRRKMARG